MHRWVIPGALFLSLLSLQCSRGPTVTTTSEGRIATPDNIVTPENKASSLSPTERALAEKSAVPDSLVAATRDAGTGLRQLKGLDANGELVPAAGLTVDVPSAQAFAVADKLRRLAGPGFVVFVSEQSFGIGGKPDAVSVMRAADPFEAVRVMGTDGANYELSNAAVIQRLRLWDRQYGLVLIGIGSDWVQATFRRPPSDMAAFAKEVYEFCPDVVSQGTDTVAALASEMTRTNSVYLWWD